MVEKLDPCSRRDVCGRIMNCFIPEALPVTNGLARAFACSDERFCSVPSQTFCNRSFFHSAQADGSLLNNFQKAFVHLIAHYRGLPPPHGARTVVELLDAVKEGGE